MKSRAINCIDCLVCSATSSLRVAVAENARGGIKSGFTLNAACSAALLMFALGAHQARAADAANATVSAGSAAVSTAGNTTTINQTSQRAAIDWTSLSTRANEALIFNQPNAQATALNRITGSSPSELLGSLSANGQVFILNPNGVLFGAGSQVNVGGLVASTLNMSNADFMAGMHVFTGSGGSVVNQGTLKAGQGGYLALLAPDVRNEGVMTASLGTALLAAGNKVTLNIDNGSGIGATTLSNNLNLGNVALATNNVGGAGNGDIHVNSAVTWNAGTTLTLSAWRNININASITSQHANGKLALEYGLGALNAGNTATYNVRAPINLRAGDNFSTRLGSDGTTDPYKVITSLGVAGSTTGTDLQGINGAPTLNYVLGADIDASDTVNWNAGAGFDTLGGVGAPGIFEGRFDGLNHKITNLFINRPGDSFVGLFGLTQSTSIRNLGLVGGSITGADFVGAIAGQGCCTTFTNVYSTAAVRGNDEVGGLVGELSDGGITDSYATGAVTGNDRVGGLVGMSLDGTITRAYSTGLVTATGMAGGLVGDQFGTATTNSSYWNLTTSGQAASAGGTGKTTAQMMQAATFAGWDMAMQGGSMAVWRIYEGQTGPLLRSFLLPITLPDTSVAYNGAQQSGAGVPGVTAASGIQLGTYLAWSGQEGYDITGGALTIRPVDVNPAPAPLFVEDEAYRSAMVYLAGVRRTANTSRGPGPQAPAEALSAAAAEADDTGNTDGNQGPR